MMSTEPSNVEMRKAVLRGTLGRCPNCGKGKLFDGYLHVADHCTECGADFSKTFAADGPAFFAQCLVFVAIIPIGYLAYALFGDNPLALLIFLVATTSIVTLLLLRYVKGALIAFQWMNKDVI